MDIAKMGEAMGALAFRATKPGDVEAAIKKALEAGRPTVIDALIDPEAKPPTAIRIETLERFFNKDAV
jgi:acetolactate synthase-1/2/3 large subunit